LSSSYFGAAVALNETYALIGASSVSTDRGNAYLVDRLMPLPFEMDIQVDLWTSNLDMKYQIAEQLLVATYPQFEIQNSENALDWTAVTVCFVEDDWN
jgi:hypothetical protein